MENFEDITSVRVENILNILDVSVNSSDNINTRLSGYW